MLKKSRFYLLLSILIIGAPEFNKILSQKDEAELTDLWGYLLLIFTHCY